MDLFLEELIDNTDRYLLENIEDTEQAFTVLKEVLSRWEDREQLQDNINDYNQRYLLVTSAFSYNNNNITNNIHGKKTRKRKRDER